MITILLTVLKILGITLLCLLALLLVLLLLVLFVPVRYKIKGCRKQEEDVPFRVYAKVSWLLSLFQGTFSYPEEAFLKVRVLGIRLLPSRKSEKKEPKEKKQAKTEASKAKTSKTEDSKTGTSETEAEKKESNKTESSKTENKKAENTEEKAVKPESAKTEQEQKASGDKQEEQEQEPEPTVSGFMKGLLSVFKNIQYTIRQIYDKIKEIIKNISFYLKIIRSDSFQRAWKLCSREAFSLIKSVLPQRLKADLIIGTGDPASTAQILAIMGILYPLTGEYISITPDFENTIAEGDFFIKGRITVFRLVKTAAKIYFNRDFRRIIRLLRKGSKEAK
jgi:hypothetical protein